MIREGTAAAPGIALGRALVKREETISVSRRTIEDKDIAAEVERFKQQVLQVEQDLQIIKKKAQDEIGEEEAQIFEAHQMILQDPEFVGAIEVKIENEKMNAESALEEIRDSFVSMFESMDNEYMRERASDLRDVSQRILKKLVGMEDALAHDFQEPIILIAHDLTPSDTAQLDRKKVKGFATNIGGRTSHSAIMARTMEIPAVVGLSDITERVNSGDWIIVDGEQGEVYIRPEAKTIQEYELKQAAFEQQKKELEKLVNDPTFSADGHQVELAANIGSPEDARQAKQKGAEGIGLFRTEFLYMGREDFPSEEEQFQAYKLASENIGKDRSVIIRTLDIGGDKELAYLNLPKELNPFLGYRAIRLCLDRPELFKVQLRAILRASHYGNIRIMYPMISTLQELRQANRILEETKAELHAENIPFNTGLEVGMMMEVPAAAMIADQLAKEVDFFSIGTNDLIQYTMAVDRMNEQVSYLYDPYHPAVLRLIHRIIQCAHQEGKWVGMCGEMAGESTAIPILLGLGLDEFSMSATSILPARKWIRQLDRSKMKEMADFVLTLESGAEIKAYIENKLFKNTLS